MDNADGLRPEQVEEIDFATVRRGFDPERVRRRLGQAAAEIRRLHDVVVGLSGRVAEFEATPPEQLEAARVAEALGDEAARLLQAARDAAHERLERAEAEHAEIIDKAHTAAAAIVEEGRNKGREVVQEAKSVRERILADLARKRRMSRAEVEQLRTVRDRLLESLSICQQGLRDWVEELVNVVPQARAAAERAGLRIAAEPEATVSQIEAEIEAGRLMGLPLDEAPEVSEPGESEPGDAASSEAEALDDGAAGWDPSHEPAVGVERVESGDTSDGVESVSLMVEPEPATLPAAAPVGLYDMEAESDDIPLAPRVATAPLAPRVATAPPPLREAAAPASWSPAPVASSPAPAADEPAPAADDAQQAAPAPAQGAMSGAEAIFARLRAVGQEIERASPSVAADADPPPPAGDPAVVAPSVMADEGLDAVGDAVTAAAATAVTEEADGGDAADAGGDAAADPADPNNLIAAARDVVVGEIARRLKRIVVDEQGELLDALRRIGPRAVGARLAADPRPFAKIVRGPFEDFASDIDASIDDIDLTAAGTAVFSVLTEPTLALLSELADNGGDLDEISAKVRSIYRESRSHRADAAARAAFAQGWREPIA